MQEEKIFPCILLSKNISFLVEDSDKQTIFPNLMFSNRFEEGAYYLKVSNNYKKEIKITQIPFENINNYKIKIHDLDKIIDDFKLIHCNVVKIGSDEIETKFGNFKIDLYEEIGYARVHYFIYKGNFLEYPTRLHSGCAKSELFQSTSCDCREELENSLSKIAEDGNGSLLYLNQEPRHLCLKTFFPEKYFDSGRDFHQACWIFKDQGFKHIKLITGNQKKLNILLEHGFTAEAVGFSKGKKLDVSNKL